MVLWGELTSERGFELWLITPPTGFLSYPFQTVVGDEYNFIICCPRKESLMVVSWICWDFKEGRCSPDLWWQRIWADSACHAPPVHDRHLQEAAVECGWQGASRFDRFFLLPEGQEQALERNTGAWWAGTTPPGICRMDTFFDVGRPVTRERALSWRPVWSPRAACGQ